MALSVSLSQEVEDRLRLRVAAGPYQSPSEVIEEALRLFEALNAPLPTSEEALRQDIQRGISDRENGRTQAFDGEAIKRQGRELLKGRVRGR